MARRIEELFYELRTHTEGLKQDLDGAQRQLGKLSQFVQDHPIAVAGALAAAFVEVGIKATEMAAESDAAMRRIAASLPTGLAGVQELDRALDQLAIKTGIAGDSLEQAAVQAAQLGATGPQEVQQLVEAAAKLADATGTSLPDSIALLVQLKREFHLTGDEALTTAAKLATAAEGKVSITELFSAFQAASPIFQKFGIDVDTGTKAIIALVQSGYGVRQVRQVLNGLDGAGIRALAAQATIAGDALQRLDDKAAITEGGVDRLDAKIKGELHQHLKELGEQLLPLERQFLELADKGVGGLARALEELEKQNSFRGGFQTVLNTLGDQQIGIGRFSTSLQALLNRFFPAPASAPALPEGFQSAIPDSALRGTPGAVVVPLGEAEKKQIQAALDSVKQSLRDFESAAQKAIAGGTQSAVDNALADLGVFRTKFVQLYGDIQQKIAALPAGAPASAKAALEASARELAGAYAKGAQDRLDELNRIAAQEADTLRATIGQSLGELTGTLAAHGADAIEQQNAKLREQVLLAGNLSNAEKLRLLDDVKLIGVLEQQKNVAADATRDVAGIIQAAESGATSPEASIVAINAKAIALKQTQDAMVRDGGEQVKQGEGYRQITGAILALDKERADLLRKILGVGIDTTADAEKRTTQLQAQARVIQQAVDGAIELAQAFGLVDANTANVLRSIGQIAAGIGPLADQLSRLHAGTGSIGGVIGAAFPIAGGVASLISSLTTESPADQERKRVLEDNTAAIRELTKKAGLLGGTDLAGSTAGAAAAALSGDFLARAVRAAAKAGEHGQNPLGADVSGVLTPDQLDAVKAAAKALGITFTGTIENFQQIDAALNAGIPILGKFGDTAKDMFSEIDAEIKIFGDQGPLADLGTVLDKFGAKSKGIASIFDGIDITKKLSDQDIATIRKRVQDLFKTMEQGGLSIEQLGDLNGSDFLQLLEQIITYLNQLGDTALTAAQKIQQGLSDIGQNATVLGETPDQQFIDKATFYGNQFGEPFKKLFEGLDLTTKEGVDEFNRRIQAFWKGVEDGSIVLDTSKFSLDDFKAGIVDLATSATSAAQAFETAAQLISDAENQIAIADDILGTSAQGTISELSQAYGIDLSQFDLTKKSGADAAIKYLQGLFTGLDPNDPNYKLVEHEIQTLVDKIRALFPDSGAAGSGGGLASGVSIPAGATSATANAIEGITHADSNRLANLYTAMLGVDRQQLVVQQQILAALTRPIITGPILPPALPQGFGASASAGTRMAATNPSGGPVINLTLQVTQDIQFSGAVNLTDAPRFSRELALFFSRFLASQLRDAQRLSGDTTVQNS